jgi:type VI secretion system protein ImpF
MWVFRSAAEARDAREKPKDKFDGEGQRLVASRGRTAASITEPILRREVWRDLDKLLNSVSLESSLPELKAFANARASIINYGLPDIAHRSIDELMANNGAIEQQIATALKTYEPRLVASSIMVKRDDKADMAGLNVRYTINADLSCQPVDIPLEFTADIELGSGKFSIVKL